jgi:hypothetical protein
MNFSERPGFIPAAVENRPLDFKWNGARDHIGPTETVTPLMERVWGTTTCGQITLCAGLLLWGGWRLRGHTDTETLLLLAEAAFAYQVDWRYLREDLVPFKRPPDEPPALSASMALIDFAQIALNPKKNWDNYYQPVRETFHSAHVVRHILPADVRKPFDAWLDVVAERVQKIAAKPEEAFRKKKEFATNEEYLEFCARHRGTPLPPQVLDPQFAYDDGQRAQLVRENLHGLNCQANMYLRSPEDMRALGFAGTPYKLDA